jgi:hypothetical protein
VATPEAYRFGSAARGEMDRMPLHMKKDRGRA